MSERVPFPTFELVGPPCGSQGCNGVLVDHADLKTKEVFRRCPQCGAETQRISGEGALERFYKVVKRISEGR